MFSIYVIQLIGDWWFWVDRIEIFFSIRPSVSVTKWCLLGPDYATHNYPNEHLCRWQFMASTLNIDCDFHNFDLTTNSVESVNDINFEFDVKLCLPTMLLISETLPDGKIRYPDCRWLVNEHFQLCLNLHFSLVSELYECILILLCFHLTNSSSSQKM